MSPMDDLEEIQRRWREKYGGMSLDERREVVRNETLKALERLREMGIEPTMSAEDLMKLTRNRGLQDRATTRSDVED